MKRAVFVVTALAVALGAKPRLVSGLLAAQQQSRTVATKVGYSYGKMAGVLGPTPLIIDNVDGKKVEAHSSPVVRANAAWKLVVTLQPPIDPKLSVTGEGKDYKAKLTAASPSATIAADSRACSRCAIQAQWVFTLPNAAPAKAGKKPVAPTLPTIAYSAAVVP